jgi:hypothetical protein
LPPAHTTTLTKLKVFTMDELLAEADKAKTRDQWIWALYQLAAAAEAEPDARIVGTFERALQQDDPDIRCATLVAIGYAEWKELGPSFSESKAVI